MLAFSATAVAAFLLRPFLNPSLTRLLFKDSLKANFPARDAPLPPKVFATPPIPNPKRKEGKKVGIYHIPNWQHNAVGVPMDLERYLKKYYESL